MGLGLAGAASAQTVFEGPGDDWTLSYHWTLGLPDAGIEAHINSANVTLWRTDSGRPYETEWFYINGGSLTVYIDGWLRTYQAMIAAGSGQTAIGSVSGPNAVWTVRRDMGIGGAGTGTFTVRNGGRLQLTATAGSGDIYLGHSGGTGTLNIGAFGGATTGGTITFSNPNSYVRFGTSGGTGNGTLNFNQTDTFTLTAGLWSEAAGKGAIDQRGTGTTWLAGDGSGYTGTISVTLGTLVLTNLFSSSTINVGASGTLVYETAVDRYSGSGATTLSGTGTIRKTGAGALRAGGATTFALGSGSLLDIQAGTFDGSNDANESWTNNKSDLNVAAGAIFRGNEGNIRVDALSGSGTITSGWGGQGSFTFGVDNGSGNFSGVLANGDSSGAFIKAGTGTQILANNNTATGALTISGGTLQVGTGGTTGSLAHGSITNNASLIFNRSDASSYAGAISGAGSVAKQGAGTLTLTGNNTFSGGLTVTGGLVQVNANARLGAGGLTLNGGGIKYGAAFNDLRAFTLGGGGAILDTNGFSVNYTPVISGTGSLTKQGAGTLALTGNNIYTGATSIEGGTLALSGTSASAAFGISAGAVLELFASGTVQPTGSTIFSGAGTLRKTGSGTVLWNAPAATFALGSGSLIDVQAGDFFGGSGWGEVWTNNKSDLHVASGATFRANEADVRVNGLSGSGTITAGYRESGIDYGSFTFGVDNASGTFSGVLADNPGAAGRFIKAGTGTYVLSGNNTFTGGLTVTGGLVQVDSDSLLGLGTLTLENGGGIKFGTAFNNLRALTVGNAWGVWDLNGFTVEYASVISGPGGLAIDGAGKLTLTGENTFAGNLSISGGTLQVGNGGTTGSLASATIANDASLIFHRSDDLTYAGEISGTGSLTKLGAGKLTLAGHNRYYGLTTISEGTLTLMRTNSSSGYDIAPGAALEVYATWGLGGQAYHSGNVTYTGAGTLRKIGPGPLNWDYSAATFALGSGSLIDVQEGILSGGRDMSWESWWSNKSDLHVAEGAMFAGQADDVRVNVLSGSGTITAGYLEIWGHFGSFTFGVDNGSGTFSGVLADGQHTWGRFFKVGTGTQVLAGNNTFTGGLVVQGGLVQVDADSRLGAGALTLDGGGIRYGAVFDLRAFTLGNGGAVLDTNGFAVDYAPVITGTGGLTKQGAGTLTLSADNTFTGVTVIDAGTLQIGDGGTTGSISGAIINNAALVFNRSDDISYAGILSGTGTLTKQGSGTLTLASESSYTGATSITGGTLVVTAPTESENFSLSAGATLELRSLGEESMRIYGRTTGMGVIRITGHAGVVLDSLDLASGSLLDIQAGSVRIGARQAFAAPFSNRADVAVAAGASLVLFEDGTFDTLSGAGDIEVDSDATLRLGLDNGSAVLTGNLTGGANLVKSGSGTQVLAGNSVFQDKLFAPAVALDEGMLQIGNGGTTGTLSGDVRNRGTLVFNRSDASSYAGIISDYGQVVKEGAGELVLTGANTYAGGTFINAGTVRTANVSGSAFGTGTVTIADGAMLTGSGAFSGGLLNHGLYAPGDSPGLAVLSSFVQGSTGVLLMEIAGLERGMGYDALDILGTAQFDGTLAVSFLGGFTAAAGQSFNLFDWGSHDGSEFAMVDLPTLGAGLAWDLSGLYTNGVLAISASAIPEPSTYALLAGIGALGLAVWRRRSRG